MKINVHAKLYCENMVYRMISSRPINIPFAEARNKTHDRYLVVPFQEFPTSLHSYIRIVDVPKQRYIVEHTEEITIEVLETAQEIPPEPELDHVTDLSGNYIPVEELFFSKNMDGGDENLDI